MPNSSYHDVLYLNRPVPRYTSYPTAPSFTALETPNTHKGYLGAINAKNSGSLYIHIPFCQQMCWYCGCNTKITKKYKSVESYLPYLFKEIEMIGQQVSSEFKINNIHFGGGSPGILTPQDFTRLVEHLKKHFNCSEIDEIAIELDPRIVTKNHMKAYAENGVNRISIGVQDFDQNVLSAVNRDQPFQLTKDTVEFARHYQIEHICFDLMYGLPLQTTSSIERTFKQALSLTPDRVAFFAYAHVPWIKKHMRLIPENKIPTPEQRLALFETGKNTLEAQGYHMIGIDHFSKKDDSLFKAKKDRTLKRNFQGYTTDTTDTLIGLGASSISKFSNGYIQNHVDMPHYKTALDNNLLPSAKTCPLSKKDIIHNDIIMQLMCFGDVNLETIAKKYDLDYQFFTPYITELADYKEKSLIKIEGQKTAPSIKIRQKPHIVTRIIASVFDCYLTKNTAPTENKHAKAI